MIGGLFASYIGGIIVGRAYFWRDVLSEFHDTNLASEQAQLFRVSQGLGFAQVSWRQSSGCEPAGGAGEENGAQ